jgi:hypothetical protein
MSFLGTNSSSSLDFEALDDHLVKSSRQETSLVKANLQDMLLHHIVVFGRAAAAAGRRDAIVHLDGYKGTKAFFVYLSSSLYWTHPF